MQTIKSIAPHASTAGLYTITASPTDESYRDSSPNSYELWITLDNYYPTHHVGSRETIVLTVQDAVCDCSEVVWDAPALVVEQHAVAQSAVITTVPKATIN